MAVIAFGADLHYRHHQRTGVAMPAGLAALRGAPRRGWRACLLCYSTMLAVTERAMSHDRGVITEVELLEGSGSALTLNLN